MQLPPKWGVVDPFYKRDGFILVMFMLFLFALGWIALFVSAIPPKVRPSGGFPVRHGWVALFTCVCLCVCASVPGSVFVSVWCRTLTETKNCPPTAVTTTTNLLMKTTTRTTTKTATTSTAAMLATLVRAPGQSTPCPKTTKVMAPARIRTKKKMKTAMRNQKQNRLLRCVL